LFCKISQSQQGDEIMVKKLTKRQIATLKRHSVHHTSKHMSFMKKKMMGGMSFGESHKLAMKQVGK
tara:strand:- start:239 stop:436 length:198 start_codon:yes stop_codon:yes gene_type:complete